MASLVLTTAANSLGSALGLSTLGTAVLKAGAGLAGGYIDRTIFGTAKTTIGPRLESLDVTLSTEGAGIPRVYGRARLGGQIIWATRLEEQSLAITQSAGGKGGPKSTNISFYYFANVAIGLCEGEIAHVGRVWVDGKELDLDKIQMRVYRGTDTQEADPLIALKEGGDAPAYRGTAYVVFERLPLADYGNRLPQFSFEVWRPVGELENKVRAVALLPGATEFGYDPVPVRQFGSTQYGDLKSASIENRHAPRAPSDVVASLDMLQALAPNLEAVSIICAWYGDSLDCAECTIAPRVDAAFKFTLPFGWSVSGLTRTTATLVSHVDGKPAYGGTPNDGSLIRLIEELKSRGLKVMLVPFLMMDIPAGNGLADPWGGPEQAAYPWRGRISASPAPGQPASLDKSAAAKTAIDGFLGAAQPADFSLNGQTVSYAGPNDWRYRRFILHHAHLALAAGGVDAFLVGSEMVSLTTVRDDTGAFPFVDGLRDLVSDVRAVLGAGTKLSYGADWSEYHSYRPADGSGDVIFHLDPFWSDPDVDFIGIDNYLPMGDWRPGFDHLDYGLQGATRPHDPAYLAANIEGGEYFDWYYATPADRAAQIRTPISDTAHGEDWIFRQKDLRSWWSQAHRNRPGGVREALPTGWSPGAKPIWFTELGAPAVDLGCNEPNVFPDPKSSESRLPHFSSGIRDDLIQRRILQTQIDYWSGDNNPVSAVYGGPMVDTAGTYLWAWDARPVPEFPRDIDFWSDADNWRIGHWISGRLGTAPMADLIGAMAEDAGLSLSDMRNVDGVADGAVIDRPMSVRAALEPLAAAFAFDLVESQGELFARGRGGNRPSENYETAALVELDAESTPLSVRRSEANTVPSAVRLRYLDTVYDDRPASVEARLDTDSERVETIDLAIAGDREQLVTLAERRLQTLAHAREEAHFALPPSKAHLEPGDMISFENETGGFLITSVQDAEARLVSATRHDAAVLGAAPATPRRGQRRSLALETPAIPVLMDLPSLDGSDGVAVYAAVHQLPWPGSVALYRSSDGLAYEPWLDIERPARIGRLLDPLSTGPLDHWDQHAEITIELLTGALQSRDDGSVLGGANAMALERPDGRFEIVQFANALLVADNQYRLSRLLRSRLSTDPPLAIEAGARIVILDDAMTRLPMGTDDIGRELHVLAVPAGKAVDDPENQETSIEVAGRSLEPLAPAHLRAWFEPSGDLQIDWVRRDRLSADSWEVAEIPMSEAGEHYEIVLADNSSPPVLERNATQTSLTITAAEYAGAFPSPPAELTISVYQRSALKGRGQEARIAING